MTTIQNNEMHDIRNEFVESTSMPNNSSDNDDDDSSNIRILTFTDYDDLQTRLVLLPRNEEIDEGIGAIISMYYRYTSNTGSTTTNTTTTSSIVDDNSSTTMNKESSSDTDVTKSLVLDTSVDGYTLVQIGTNDCSNNNDTNIDSTTQPLQNDPQFKLLEEDFASILSTIRHHTSKTPIVLTFMKHLPQTTHDELDESSNNNNDDGVNVDTPNVKEVISSNNTDPLKEPQLSVCKEDEKKSDDHDLSTANTTATSASTSTTTHASNQNTTSSSLSTNENDTSCAVPQSEASNNDSNGIVVADQTPPPPPSQDESSSTSNNNNNNNISSSVSPNTMFSSKHLSSIWNNRIRTVANTKAVVAFVNAANEHAKHTTALVTSVVIPEFPSSTTISSKVDTTNTIDTATTTGATTITELATTATSEVTTTTDVRATIIDSPDTIQIPQDTTTTSVDDEVETQKESLSNTINTSIIDNKPTPIESEINVVELLTTSLESNHTITSNNDIVPSPIPMPTFNIYVQSETGAFVPVPEVTSSPSNMAISSTTPITNSSYVMMRISTTEPAPINQGYYYQWYRSSSLSSSATNTENEWVKLLGANTPTLQPSATEIGYRLRCVISTTKNYEIHHNHNDSNHNHQNRNNVMICDTVDTVTASLPILNGSRQALARGAQFGGLLGQGKAENRTFRVKIVLSSHNNNNSSSNNKTLYENGSWSQHSSSTSTNMNTIAAVTIYQVSGTMAEPIHPEHEPLLCRSATVWDYSQIKDIALIFNSHELPPSASMVAALCSHEKYDDVDDDMDDQHNDDNNHYFDPTKNHRLYFRLQAPNRLARESMLLSIGIANYQGKPSELNASTVLFYHHVHSNEGSNSGSASSSLGDDSIVSHSSPSPPWPPTRTPQKIIVQHLNSSVVGDVTDGTKSDLELELEALRSKLARKDKVISELQRQVTLSDEVQRHTEEELRSVQLKLEQTQKESLMLQKSLVKSEDNVKNIDEEIQKVKLDHGSKYEAIEGDLQLSKNRISTLEKENRTLQNDKDVLKAAIESRDFKLMKMEEIQASLDEARVKLSQRNNFQLEVDEANKRYTNVMNNAERLRLSIRELEEELSNAKEQIITLEQSLQIESTKNSSHQSKLEMEQMKVQKLKAERNSYKQKCDSLAKEMNRICRDGRSIREIEKILADDATRREEVNVLREQKRKALEQVEQFRTAYEQSIGIQKLAGLDHDSIKLLERNAELERLLSELTEYVTAKEMQLDTMKQVNDTLQFEIRELAKASMSKNDI
jgi:hypothetical protein